MKLGRDVVFEYLHHLGVECVFGVPGTNEIPLIDGTSMSEFGVRYIPCLHENIAVGAAMGYARTCGRPGVVELHMTPGAAHGLGNLFNAYRSGVPVVVLCAQQDVALIAQEPLLASDLVQVARQYAKWAYEVRFADELPLILQRAFKVALTPPTQPVFVSIPWEFTLAQVADGPARVTRVAHRFVGDQKGLCAAADCLAAAERPIVIAGDGVGAAEAWGEIEALADVLGAPVYSQALGSYMNFPNHCFRWQGELPQLQTKMHQIFRGHDVAFLCGYNAQAQVLVFKYAWGPLIPRKVIQVSLDNDAWQLGKNDYAEVAVLGDIAASLPVLCDAIRAHPRHDRSAAARRNEQLQALGTEREQHTVEFRRNLAARPPASLPYGADVASALATLQPSMRAPLLLSNEAVSDSAFFQRYPTFKCPRDYFFGGGGALGFSMPAALGMKIAAGDTRTVVNVVGDGSALFYPHTWWTAHKLGLAILFVITNNREYKTLQIGLQELECIYSWTPSGDPWYLRLDDRPTSYVSLARALGIDGALVSELGELEHKLKSGLAAVESGRPFVLEVLTDRSLCATPPGAPRVDALQAAKEESHDRRWFIGPV
ncbi:MAG: thiamine pyrophosphate-binding protein [Solirubrobacterales bacterium]|nr:thiamine pyrophosphate-binding protein [Solirubrobacterales bacterium]